MAKVMTPFDPELMGALRALLGEDLSSVRRVVIDIQGGHVPIVHIERYGDEKMIDVVRTLAGVEIERKDR